MERTVINWRTGLKEGQGLVFATRGIQCTGGINADRAAKRANEPSSACA